MTFSRWKNLEQPSYTFLYSHINISIYIYKFNTRYVTTIALLTILFQVVVWFWSKCTQGCFKPFHLLSRHFQFFFGVFLVSMLPYCCWFRNPAPPGMCKNLVNDGKTTNLNWWTPSFLTISSRTSIFGCRPRWWRHVFNIVGHQIHWKETCSRMSVFSSCSCEKWHIFLIFSWILQFHFCRFMFVGDTYYIYNIHTFPFLQSWFSGTWHKRFEITSSFWFGIHFTVNHSFPFGWKFDQTGNSILVSSSSTYIVSLAWLYW